MRKAEALAFLVLFGTATAAGAGWREAASPYDAARFAKLEESRAKGLIEIANASPADQGAIRAVLGAAAVPASAAALQGNWRCRTLKLGGMTPAVVYTWFRCRISYKGGAFFFEKLSGSQRTSGALYPEDGGFVYLGASYVTGEKPHAYSGTGSSVGAPATPDDQIGLLSLLADGRARLELPYPMQESTFDVLELKR